MSGTRQRRMMPVEPAVDKEAAAAPAAGRAPVAAGEAERASKAWKNMLGVCGRRRSGGRTPDTENRDPACPPKSRRLQGKPKEYRWYTLAGGRRVFRPAVRVEESKRSRLPAPQISPDYRPYDCPITGRMIEGRRAHRENLERHGCRVLEPGETAQHKRDRPREKEAALSRAIEESAREAAQELFV